MLILFGCAVIVIVNAVLFRGRLTAWVADGSGRVLAPMARRSAHLRALVLTAAGRGDLAAKNVALQDEVLRLRSQLADEEEMQRQIDFYRDAAGIRERTGAEPIAAGIFSFPQSGGVRQAVINRGHAEWVVPGDVVVTPSGALVGEITSIFEHHSVVRTVGDIAMDVAVRILGTQVSGLLRSSDSEGIYIDLVQKNETVTENSVVVTSGDDQYPAGLVVGSVSSVDNDSATLFKMVHVTTAVGSGLSGDVIVIKP